MAKKKTDETTLWVRLPRELHERLSDMATEQDRSIASVVRLLLVEGVEHRDAAKSDASEAAR